MRTDNPLVDKSYAFALRVVKLCRYLSEEKKEFVISKQILRSGTSIGANVEEAQAQSLLDDCDELLKTSSSIIVTLKEQRDSESDSNSSFLTRNS